MLYREIIAVCSEIHTKHINTLCGQNIEFLNVKLMVHMVRTWIQWVESCGQRDFKTSDHDRHFYCNNKRPFMILHDFTFSG